jgi:hypothetical protein
MQWGKTRDAAELFCMGSPTLNKVSIALKLRNHGKSEARGFVLQSKDQGLSPPPIGKVGGLRRKRGS